MNLEVLRKMYDDRVAQSQIAATLQTTQATVSRTIKRLGWQRSNLNQLVSDAELIAAKDSTIIELSRRFGISNQAIHERLVRLGVNTPLSDRVVSSSDKIRQYHPDLSHFDPLDEIGCYWLGFIYADGSLWAADTRPNILSIKLQRRDAGLLHQLATDLALPPALVRLKPRYVSFILSNIHLGQLLCGHGLAATGYKRHLPNLGMMLPHFVRGFLDGDGGIYIRKPGGARSRQHEFLAIRLAITYEEFGLELKTAIASQTGIDMNGLYPDKSIYFLSVSHRKAVDLARWIWANPTRALGRKLNKWLEYQDKYFRPERWG